MARKVAPTYQHKLFHDDELALPSHDAICRWIDLTAKTNPAVFLRKIGLNGQCNENGQFCCWAEEQIDNECDDRIGMICQKIATQYKPDLSSPPPVVLEHVKWEPLIKSEKGGLVGATDLLIRFRVAIPSLKYKTINSELTAEEKKILTNTGFDRFALLVGADGEIWDIQTGNRQPCPINIDTSGFAPKFLINNMNLIRINHIGWEIKGQPLEYETLDLMCEAKTSFPTVGATLRQINLYKSHGNRFQKWLVVAPADAWPSGAQEILSEQGVTPVTYLSN
jgi:hypothetical protein